MRRGLLAPSGTALLVHVASQEPRVQRPWRLPPDLAHTKRRSLVEPLSLEVDLGARVLALNVAARQNGAPKTHDRVTLMPDCGSWALGGAIK